VGAAASNTEIVRDLITHFFNDHDVEVAEHYFATDLKWHGGLVGDVEGVRPYADVMRGFFAALPDVHAVEQDALESGNTVSMRFVVEGTHEGQLWGLPPSGRRLRWDAIMIYRMHDGEGRRAVGCRGLDRDPPRPGGLHPAVAPIIGAPWPVSGRLSPDAGDQSLPQVSLAGVGAPDPTRRSDRPAEARCEVGGARTGRRLADWRRARRPGRGRTRWRVAHSKGVRPSGSRWRVPSRA